MIGGDEIEGQAALRAEFEAEAFRAAVFIGEHFDIRRGVFTGESEGDVAIRVWHVFPAATFDRGKGSGADAEVIRTEPVGLVVLTTVARLGVVGDFVVLEAVRFEQVDGEMEEIGIATFIGAEFALLEAAEEVGILLIVEVVGRNMIWFQRQRMFEGLTPCSEFLTGNRKHHIEVQTGEIRLAEHLPGFLGLGRRVIATERFERGIVPGLDPEGDASDAHFSHERRFGRRHGAWIGLHREFDQIPEVETLLQATQQALQMRITEHGGRATAEKDRLRLQRLLFDFFEQRIDKRRHVRPARCVLVKAAIRADAVAEGDVDVEVAQGSTLFTL